MRGLMLEAVLGGRLVLTLLLIRMGHIRRQSQSRRRGQWRGEGKDGEAFYVDDDPHPFLCVSVKGINTRNGINCGWRA